MIDRLQGVLLDKSPVRVVVEVGGLGLAVAIPLTTFEKLPRQGERVSLVTHLHVREDALELFGFQSEDDRALFRSLIAISGIGPKIALAILSKFTAAALSQVVGDGDLRRLQAVPGVGKKTAERLMIELKDRFRVRSPVVIGGIGTGVVAISAISEAIRALETLGYSLPQAEEAVRRATSKINGEPTTEEIVRSALRGR